LQQWVISGFATKILKVLLTGFSERFFIYVVTFKNNIKMFPVFILEGFYGQ